MYKGDSECPFMNINAKNAGIFLNFWAFGVVMIIMPPVPHAEEKKPRGCCLHSHPVHPVPDKVWAAWRHHRPALPRAVFPEPLSSQPGAVVTFNCKYMEKLFPQIPLSFNHIWIIKSGDLFGTWKNKGKGERNEYLGFCTGHRRLVYFTGIHPTQTWHIHLTEK